MRILLLDTETTGIGESDRMIEIAAAGFCTEARDMFWAWSTVLPAPENPAESVNGIGPAMLAIAEDLYGLEGTAFAVRPLVDIISLAEIEAIGAHNADFDRPVVRRALGCELARGDQDVPWFCTWKDVQYPSAHNSSRHLPHLAVDHGISVGVRHRALADVLMLVEIFRRLDGLEQNVRQALKPRGLFQAVVPYEKRDLAKDAGFQWNAKARRWEKRMPLDTPLAAHAERPFPLNLIEVQ